MPSAFLETVFWFAAAAPSLDAGDVSAATRLEDACVRQRREMRSSHVKLKVLQETTAPQSSKTFHVELWTSDGNYRSDIEHPDNGVESGGPNVERFAVNDAEKIRWTKPLDAAGQRVVATVMPRGDVMSARDLTIDHRLLGIAPLRLGHMHFGKISLNVLVGTDQRSNLKATSTDGTVRLAFDLVKPRTAKVELRFDAVKSGALLAVEMTPVPTDASSLHLTCEYGPAPLGGVWYPSKTVLEEREKGNVAFRETIELIEGSFNEPIDPEVFRVGGVVDPGSVVANNAQPGKLKKWDGETLADFRPRDPRETAAEAEAMRPRGWGIWHLANGALFAIAALLIWWKYFRGSRL